MDLDVANKAGGVAHRTGKLLIRDGKKDELILLSEATFIFKCNQNDADDLITSCKVKNLIAVLTSSDANISLEARIMSIMDM